MLDEIALELSLHEVFRAALESRPIFFMVMASPYFANAMNFRMSSTRQTVICVDSLIAGGYRPDFTPAHQHDFLTGISAGIGGVALGSPIICGRRKKPISGSEAILDFPGSSVTKKR